LPRVSAAAFAFSTVIREEHVLAYPYTARDCLADLTRSDDDDYLGHSLSFALSFRSAVDHPVCGDTRARVPLLHDQHDRKS